MNPLPISDNTPYTVDVKVGAQLYLPDLTPKVLVSNVVGVYSPFGSGAYRAAYISTGGVTMLLLAKTADCTLHAIPPVDCTAAVDAATAPLKTQIASLQAANAAATTTGYNAGRQAVVDAIAGLVPAK